MIGRFTVAAFHLLVSLGLIGASPATAAQPAQDFYKGKQITMIVAAVAGGGYDTYARPLRSLRRPPD